MANFLLPGDAKKLVEYHNTLLRAADEVRSRKAAFAAQVLTTVKRMQVLEYFERRAENELSSGQEALPDAQLNRLLLELRDYQQYAAQVDECERMWDEVIPDVQHALQVIGPLLGGLKWMFASAQAKESAAAALNYLRELLNTRYPDAVCDASEARGLSPLNSEELMAEFSANRSQYLQTLVSLLPELMETPSDAVAYAPLLKSIRTIVDRLKEADREAELCRKQVAGAAAALLQQAVLRTLRSIPVEELKNAREGVRIKSLRDSGYETMADIFSATHYQLAAVNGISEEGADDIKRYTSTMAEALLRRTGLRLNADDHSSESGQLLLALLKYIRRMGAMQQLKELKQEKPDLQEDFEILNQIAAPARMLFLSPVEKQPIFRSSRELQDLAGSDYAERTLQMHKDMMLSDLCSVEEAYASFLQHPVTFLTALEQAVPGITENGDGLYGLPEELATELQKERTDLQGLKCTLRSYQELGVKYILHQKKVLLGDEMGLGKTVQAIAAMVALRNSGHTHFLVICPASVITNWCREISNMSDLEVIQVHGTGRENAVGRWIKNGGTAVTTYETCSNMQLEEDMHLSMLVVDEAHYIKNRQTRRSFFVREIAAHAEWVLFMTGTALENRAEEMVSLVEGLQPEIAERIHHMTYMVSAPQFRKEIAPVYYRRKREDVLTELPEKIEMEEWCDLSEEERERYEVAVIDGNYAEIRRVSWTVDAKDSCKAQRLKELVEEAESDGRKVIVFSFFLDTIRKVREVLGERCTEPINGSVPPEKRQAIIDAFHAAPAGAVLPAQIQSGGTGLNIQGASVVILCEPQLKPSIENQAISRVYRMGQARNVLVYRLLCTDTIDETIMDLLREKQAVFDAFADRSDAAQSMEVDERSFGDIVREEAARIQSRNS